MCTALRQTHPRPGFVLITVYSLVRRDPRDVATASLSSARRTTTIIYVTTSFNQVLLNRVGHPNVFAARVSICTENHERRTSGPERLPSANFRVRHPFAGDRRRGNVFACCYVVVFSTHVPNVGLVTRRLCNVPKHLVERHNATCVYTRVPAVVALRKTWRLISYLFQLIYGDTHGDGQQQMIGPEVRTDLVQNRLHDERLDGQQQNVRVLGHRLVVERHRRSQALYKKPEFQFSHLHVLVEICTPRVHITLLVSYHIDNRTSTYKTSKSCRMILIK